MNTGFKLGAALADDRSMLDEKYYKLNLKSPHQLESVCVLIKSLGNNNMSAMRTDV